MRAIAFCLALALAAAPAVAEEARHLFGAVPGPGGAAPAPIGSYAAGCLAGGVALDETGEGWQAMRLSRGRNFGHPAMIAFVERLGKKARALGWPGVYVGDISQPRGGPMLSGHASHQIGLDADIWLRRPAERPLTRAERERIGSPSVVGPDGRAVNERWSMGHHWLIEAAARDAAVARIFVNRAIKKALCEAEPDDGSGGDRAWLRKVRPWWGHDAHFHVRLRCPEGTPLCVDQAPPPPGDGCGAELASWFAPPPPAASRPKAGRPTRGRRISLWDMPRQCATLVE
ncbi:MAG: penicillin-insensitive murein endopeptidase [Paracoccaceae bacterium]